MSVTFNNIEVSKPILNYVGIISWIKLYAHLYSYKLGELTFIFCSDEYLKDINVKYLSHDYYTDIITFDYTEDYFISGDMFISIERIKDNSSNMGIEFDEEILRVIIHGLLHLIGFNDSSEIEKIIMRNVENESIIKFKSESNV